MKRLFNVFLFCMIAGITQGQVRHNILDQDGRPVSFGVSALHSKIPLFLQTDSGTRSISPFNAIPNDPLGSIVFLNRASKVLVTTRLRKDSLSYYRYSITENDTNVIVSNALLTKVDFVWNNRSSWPGYLTMNLGISDVVNKKLTVKIYRLPDESAVTTLIIYNKPIKPAAILNKSLVELDHIFYVKGTNFSTPRFKATPLNNGAAFTVGPKVKHIYLSMQKTDLDFIYHIYLKYKGRNGDHTALISGNWEYGSYEGIPNASIDAAFFSRPGKYELVIMPQTQAGDNFINSDQSVKIAFEVLAPPASFSVKELALLALALLMLAAGIFFLVRESSRRKLTVANMQAEAAKTELTGIRAQLNPHFVFNALGGIQNLINKNEVEMANNYLSKFARLTRHVLNDDALISIKEEVNLLTDYLCMEQLRFSFTYHIQVDESENFANTEIPSMLVQPFVENAVKHAMARLKENGKVLISFVKDGTSLVITVTDNGKGFNTRQNYDGWGLKLSKKRIALLNSMYKECPLNLVINSAPASTEVKLTLTHWL